MHFKALALGPAADFFDGEVGLPGNEDLPHFLVMASYRLDTYLCLD